MSDLIAITQFGNFVNYQEKSLELIDGEQFFWKPFETITAEEMDKRIAYLSLNIPKVISDNTSIDLLKSEMSIVGPLCSQVNITSKREIENRDTNLFFAIIGHGLHRFDPLSNFSQKIIEKCYLLQKEEGQIRSVEVRFFIRRLSNLPINSSLEELPCGNDLGSVTELDFTPWSRLYPMQYIPDELGLFKNLRKIDFSGHNITDLPDSICNLARLETLDLHNTKLIALPTSLSKLSNLKTINIRYTPIPAEIRLKLANDFVDNGNISAALSLLDPMEATKTYDKTSYVDEPYDSVIELLKKITEKVLESPQQYHFAANHILNLINGLPDNIKKFNLLLVILKEFHKLKRAGISYDEELIYKQCFDIAFQLSDGSEKFLLFRDLAVTLFSIENYQNGLEIIDEAIKCIELGPDYNHLTMCVDTKKAEYEGISKTLADVAIKLAKENNFELARKILDKIPLVDLKTYVNREISNLEKEIYTLKITPQVSHSLI